MYSGGVDSVGVLYRLLTDDAYAAFAIRVHHMQLINREKRAAAEKQAVNQTLKLFAGKKFRPFTFTHCLHDYSFMKRDMIWDMDIANFMAANICAGDRDIVHVARGRTRTDLKTGGEMLLKRSERAMNIFNAIIEPSKSEATIIYPVIDLDKTEIWQMLPKPFREASWYCRTPIYDKAGKAYPCNRCVTCREMREVYEACGEKPPVLPKGLVPTPKEGIRAVVKRVQTSRATFTKKAAMKKA
ncbi:hypothetical protein PSDVSF_10950 [Pseudodesulfovibrio sediminis]|uniref:7-cyano-7-deazaguanine synthase n=2 Tax=Pseudodesulfovibrio sediminis TaxID=2810563 RepID=A0ABM7P4P9_9BACT|nr:hypothetical protein PSDVSF_10950 [Pseudodesulfovibrio sediminis]